MIGLLRLYQTKTKSAINGVLAVTRYGKALEGSVRPISNGKFRFVPYNRDFLAFHVEREGKIYREVGI